MKFCEWSRHQDATVEVSVHSILWTEKGCFMGEGVFTVHNSCIWEQNYPYFTREYGYEFRFCVNVWAGVVGSTFVWDVTGSLQKV
jgi:hypothetical protein